jgi:hypothetical protein
VPPRKDGFSAIPLGDLVSVDRAVRTIRERDLYTGHRSLAVSRHRGRSALLGLCRPSASPAPRLSSKSSYFTYYRSSLGGSGPAERAHAVSLWCALFLSAAAPLPRLGLVGLIVVQLRPVLHRVRRGRSCRVGLVG